MSRMDSEWLERVKAQLVEEKRKLWGELREDLFHTFGEELHTQYEIPQDVPDQGVIELLADTGLALADIRKEELMRIEEALNRLSEGNYGLCADCGEPIGEARLRVSPSATCCISCQNQRESSAAAAGPAP